jgi:tetratricopeptide (TPR) repeat protein
MGGQATCAPARVVLACCTIWVTSMWAAPDADALVRSATAARPTATGCAGGDALSDAREWASAQRAYAKALAAGERCDLGRVDRATTHANDGLFDGVLQLSAIGRRDLARVELARLVRNNPEVAVPPTVHAAVDRTVGEWVLLIVRPGVPVAVALALVGVWWWRRRGWRLACSDVVAEDPASTTCSPATVQSGLLEQLAKLTDDGPQLGLRVSGPDRPVDINLGTLGSLGDPTILVRLLQAVVPPSKRSLTLSGVVTTHGDHSFLALTLRRGDPSAGPIVAAQVVRAPVSSKVSPHEELAAKVAAWAAFEYHRAKAGPNSRPMRLLGTPSWDSYGSFLSGVAAHNRGDRTEAIARYRTAIKADPENIGAKTNLARLFIGTDDEASIFWATSALASLGDADPAVSPDEPDLTARYVWEPTWYRAMFSLVSSTLNAIARTSPRVAPERGDQTAAHACCVAERLWRTAVLVHAEAAYGDKHKPPGTPVTSASLRQFLETLVLPSATVIYGSSLVEVRRDAEAFELVAQICKEDGGSVCYNMAALHARAGLLGVARRWMTDAIEFDPAFEASAHTDPSLANLSPPPEPPAARVNL